MLSINISFNHNGLDFTFNDEIEQGKPHTFKVGEQSLADKLFWVLVGLDKDYKGSIDGDGICFNASTWNNVLALGDNSMFLPRSTIRHNIYKALRVRADRKAAKVRTEEIIELYNLHVLAGLKPHYLTDEELTNVALARAHYREIRLVVIKGNDAEQVTKIALQKWPEAYIIEVI